MTQGPLECVDDRLAMALEGISIAEIARRTGLPTELVARCLSGRLRMLSFYRAVCHAFSISPVLLLTGVEPAKEGSPTQVNKGDRQESEDQEASAFGELAGLLTQERRAPVSR